MSIDCDTQARIAANTRRNSSQPISRVLSRTVIHLRPASPQDFSSLPESNASNVIRFLFGLAPSGVYHAIPVTRNAVRSYRTISPLPHHSPIASSYKIKSEAMSEQCGGIFSAALSVGSRPPGVTWHSALWSPDFPLPHHATPRNCRIESYSTDG